MSVPFFVCPDQAASRASPDQGRGGYGGITAIAAGRPAIEPRKSFLSEGVRFFIMVHLKSCLSWPRCVASKQEAQKCNGIFQQLEKVLCCTACNCLSASMTALNSSAHKEGIEIP